MKRTLFTLFVIATLAGGLALAEEAKPAAKAEAKAAEPKGTNAEPAETRISRDANGNVVLALTQETQSTMGLQVTNLTAAQLSPELKGYGRVLDISPLATLVAELTTAQAANDASQAELKRLKTLAAQSNASERALQTAEAAAARDQAQVESTRLRLLAGWGSVLAERKDLPALVQQLGSLASALVELDVPPGQPINQAPTGARLFTLAEGSNSVDAQYLGPAPMVDPQLQGRGYLFLVSPNPWRLAPGMAVTGLLRLPGEEQSGVALPGAAVVRYNGATWIYLQTGNTTFQRTEVALGCPLAQGWFVRQGLKPQDKVVVVGAQQLLSEELKGQSGE